MRKILFFMLIGVLSTINLYGQSVEFEQYKLDNGLTIILHHR